MTLARRNALGLLALGGAGAALAGGRDGADLHFEGGDGARSLTDAYPGKRGMILLRERAPLLETPLEALDGQVFTPNDRFFVRWHYDDIPTRVDAAAFRLNVFGAVNRPVAIPLAELLKLPRVELAAVNQCSGNSRGYFSPRVPGAQWGDGAIGNALWAGVRLKDVLDYAGVRAGSVAVRMQGLDRPPPGAPHFAKSLGIDHARDGEVMIAFAMNGAPLPLLNGFPLRLVVPGWYSTYWIKALDSIEVLDAPDTGYWMEKAYRIPTTPRASVAPGSKDFPTEPINRMVPRAFFTSARHETRVAVGSPLRLRGLALGGDRGVARVELAVDGGAWQPAKLGPDQGKYGFRLWQAALPALPPGAHRVTLRCTNTAGARQSATPVWNPGGYMLDTIETLTVHVA